MGGLVFIAGTLVAYVAGHLTLKTLPHSYIVPPGPTITGLVLLGLFVFCGAIGFFDDFLKVRKRNSLGLNKRGQAGPAADRRRASSARSRCTSRRAPPPA